MINKKEKTVEVVKEVTESITCDICKKTYDMDDIFEIQEFVHIRLSCGYGSVFGDGDLVELDMCQHCLNEHLGEYIRVSDDLA